MEAPVPCGPFRVYLVEVRGIALDRRIDQEEQRFLVAFTDEFVRSRNGLVLEGEFNEELVRQGICMSQPEITFEGKMFCVTGISPRASRAKLEAEIERLGGTAHPRVIQKLDYLVVAAGRTLSWAFSCYGRKVEAAMTLRRQGARLTIVHESDFWDAVRDHGLVVA